MREELARLRADLGAPDAAAARQREASLLAEVRPRGPATELISVDVNSTCVAMAFTLIACFF